MEKTDITINVFRCEKTESIVFSDNEAEAICKLLTSRPSEFSGLILRAFTDFMCRGIYGVEDLKKVCRRMEASIRRLERCNHNSERRCGETIADTMLARYLARIDEEQGTVAIETSGECTADDEL